MGCVGQIRRVIKMPDQYVSLSGGLASAVAAERALIEGGGRVTLLFADTLWEDADLYRFLNDLEARWRQKIVRLCDGRTPLEVAEQKHIIPNHRMAPCSYELKGKLIDAYVPTGGISLLGLDWREMHRIEKVRARFAGSGKLVDFPLLWKPYPVQTYYDTVRAWGIKPPRLYDLGMSHNNCGGRCVRQGVNQWNNLRATLPERFAEMAEWEQAQRAKGGARGRATFLTDRVGGNRKSLTLLDMAARKEPLGLTFDDQSACVCNDWEHLG
jgi:3'-phosphoadenosine 5'-phosphosulfate sulfotransferase (PAPS reductase)/FAD synthetase